MAICRGVAALSGLLVGMGCAQGSPTSPSPVDATSGRSAYQAIEAKVSATPEQYSGACPKTVSATATITTDGPATVEYEWESAGGYTQPEEVLVFTGAGTREIATRLPVSATSSGWVRLRIAQPNVLVSNAAGYSVTCME